MSMYDPTVLSETVVIYQMSLEPLGGPTPDPSNRSWRAPHLRRRPRDDEHLSVHPAAVQRNKRHMSEDRSSLNNGPPPVEGDFA